MATQKLTERAKWRAWYKLPIWTTTLRPAQLRRQPLCERHLWLGRNVIATVVNHKRPHRGDWALFIDPGNLESACKACHDSLIKREESRGHVIGADINGRPLDPNHPWNRR